MNIKTPLAKAMLLAALILSIELGAFAQGTAFTYQCYLTQNGTALNGVYDLQFSLYSANNGGSQVGATLTTAAASVNGGLYTAQLDFGAGIFNGQPRWLQIAIRPSGGGTYTPLVRQLLTPAPYAIFAGSSG